MIKIRDLTFEYFDRDDEGNLTDMINAIRGINFDAVKGEFIAVAGKNGSGKSTFAKILNRLLVPIEGTVIIGGKDAMDEENTLDIRKLVGMVFQNPDDQIIGSVVAEDVAFGAENIGVPQYELWDRVLNAIEQAGLYVYSNHGEENAADMNANKLTNTKDAANNSDNVSGKKRLKKARKEALKRFADRKINALSGGEKQKVAIAGVLAMKPACIVLDESTSMLDPKSRIEILGLMKELNVKYGITVIMITHMMDELIWADTIYIMNQGKLVMKGRKESIFAEPDKLAGYGLECPEIVNIKNRLCKSGIIRDQYIYTVDALVQRIKKEHPYAFELGVGLQKPENIHVKIDPVNAILVNNLSFSYGRHEVLKNISLSVAKGEYVAVIGETGSGKSTLLQHIPGLLKAKSGEVYVDGLDVADRTTDIQSLRCKIGYVFQYPEQQLFAKNVYEDVVFGPRNVGISEVEAEKRAYEAIQLVGLSDEIYDMPIHKLSGGQKRRVALAGVLAMKPEYLILDEPTAGLDPEGRCNMLEIIDMLHKEAGITIIMVSHDIESVAAYADRVIVLEHGEVKYNGKPEHAFYGIAYENIVRALDDNGNYVSHDIMGLADDISTIPVIMQLLVKLRLAGLPVDCLTVNQQKGIENIMRALM